MAEPTPRGQSQANLGLPPHFSLPQGWRRLGRGQFGSVYLVFRTSPTDPGAPGEWVAVKIYQELSKLQVIFRSSLLSTGCRGEKPYDLRRAFATDSLASVYLPIPLDQLARSLALPFPFLTL